MSIFQSRKILQPFQFLAQHELWHAVLLVGLSILQPVFLPWAALGLGILSLIRWLGKGRWSVRTPVDGPIIVLALMALISLWITPLPGVTLPEVYRLLTGLALFYVIVNWSTKPAHVAWLTVGTAGLAPGLAFMAIFSVNWPAGKLPLIPRSLYEPFAQRIADAVHPNVLAGNLAVVMPVCLALFLFRWGEGPMKHWQRILLRLLLGGMLAFCAAIL